MACEPMDRIMSTLRVRVPGATDEILQLELYNVLDRFFRRTNVWRYHSTTNLEKEITRYNIFPPADAALVRVMWAIHGLNPIPGTTGEFRGTVSRGLIDQDATSVPGQDMLYDPDRLSRPSGTTFQYALYFPSYVQVQFPADDPTATQYPVEIEMALTLGSRCIECDAGDWGLDEWMYDRYANDWVDGVQASMFSMMAKPWSNPALAAFHGRQFVKAMSAAKVEGEKGVVYNTQNWRFPRGGFLL
jgi:hypothetical protein